MKKANNDIREAINKANLKYYQVAKAYGLSDSNFTKLLRFELSNDKKEKILKIIKQLEKSNHR